MAFSDEQLHAINSNFRTMNWQPPWCTKERYLNPESFEGEDWKDLTEWRGHKLLPWYELSNLGRLRRKCYDQVKDDPRISLIREHSVKIYPGTLDMTTGGYIATGLTGYNSEWVSFSYHQGVATLFIGSRPHSNYVVDHISNDKLDNRITNLRWIPSSENNRKAIYIDKVCSEFVNKMQDNNRIYCRFLEYPDQIFSSIREASEFIGRNSYYIRECVHEGRPVRDKDGNVYHPEFLHGGLHKSWK